jgi:Family of unknown function (DUF6352)
MMTHDFWLSCGHHLLDRADGGGLVVTDQFLKAYLARPELVPPLDACAAERVLYEALTADPCRPVSASEIAQIADADARENWQLLIDFRDRLLRHPTLEAAYLGIVRDGGVPPLFINQLVHVVLRNALDGNGDPLVLRAAELFFRLQRVTLHEGALLATDEETVGGMMTTPVSPLVSMLGLPEHGDIDVMNAENAASYWERSDRYDVAIDLTAGREGLSALARAMQRWTEHLLNVRVEIEPVKELREVNWRWYVGLDAEATKIGDQLWNDDDIDEDTMRRVVGLFRLTFRDPDQMLEHVRGEPAYLILAMTRERTIRMKPQNLVMGLPVRQLEGIG